MKISIIITAWKEPATVSALVRDLEKQVASCKGNLFEILLVCPDAETLTAGKDADYLKILNLIKDEGKGKPAALNLAFGKSKGEILILTDGDVKIGKSAIERIISGYNNKQVGAIAGHPKPLNLKTNMFGYWAHLLTEAGAHRERLKKQKNGELIICSGYLMSFRKNLVNRISEDSLVDDAVISYLVWNQGYKINYIPSAEVFVKFPSNFKDWLKQKKRSAGGYVQLPEIVEVTNNGRNFSKESAGIIDAFTYPKNLKEFWWTILLVFARLYLWLLIFWEQKIIKKSFEDTWVRVESTK